VPQNGSAPPPPPPPPTTTTTTTTKPYTHLMLLISLYSNTAKGQKMKERTYTESKHTRYRRLEVINILDIT
jgi:hypothetical protein